MKTSSSNTLIRVLGILTICVGVVSLIFGILVLNGLTVTKPREYSCGAGSFAQCAEGYFGNLAQTSLGGTVDFVAKIAGWSMIIGGLLFGSSGVALVMKYKRRKGDQLSEQTSAS